MTVIRPYHVPIPRTTLLWCVRILGWRGFGGRHLMMAFTPAAAPQCDYMCIIYLWSWFRDHRIFARYLH